MKKTLLLTTITGTMFMFSGCATLFGGGAKQQITINTKKPTIVTIGHTKDGKNIIDPQIIKAPGIVVVTRENKDILIKTQDGKTKLLKKKTNLWFLGDVLAASPLSTTVDLITGAMWKYDNNISIGCRQ